MLKLRIWTIGMVNHEDNENDARFHESSPPIARLDRYIGAYFVCHLASYDACALIPFKLFMGFRTLWALELAGAGYPLWLWAASPFACRWGPPAVTFCKIKEDAWGLYTVDIRHLDVYESVFSFNSVLIERSWLSGKFMRPNARTSFIKCRRALILISPWSRSSIYFVFFYQSYIYERCFFFKSSRQVIATLCDLYQCEWYTVPVIRTDHLS